MMQKNLVMIAPVLALAWLGIGLADPAAPTAARTQTATGRVFHDKNGNGTYDAGEPLLSQVRVSNGRDIVMTDEDGRYELSVDDDDIIFVIKPRNYRTPVSEMQLPQFYYVHKPAGSPKTRFPGVKPTGPLPKSIDFPLIAQAEPEQFHALLFGDPQPRTQKEIDYMSHDVIEDLVGTDASFGVTLGDIVFDDLSLFEPQARAIALLGIPWYNVIGNHDINYDAKHDHLSDETFERVFGPSYYSFDHGPVHFLVLDDVEWYIKQDGKGTYRGGLGDEQMEFIRKDLALIPEDQLVVLMMHIPLLDVHDRHELYRLIEQRPFCVSISAHKHVHQHRFITRKDGWHGPEPHHHVVNVTVCGSWWRGAPDERGVPHALMADGAPNGYSVISFDGHDYHFDFHSASRSASYQMQIHAPEVVKADAAADTQVYANVFNGSEKCTVEMKIDGEWRAMKYTLEMDPGYIGVYKREEALKDKAWPPLVKPGICRHLWKLPLPADLPAGSHLMEFRSTDPAGRQVHGRRVIRVE